MSPIPLDKQQRYRDLIEKFDAAIKTRDVEGARRTVAEITKILRPLRQEAKLNKFKLYYFEMLLDVGETDKAKKGFQGIKERMHPKTRVHLEAAGFLAICHLRNRETEPAEKLMAYVMSNTDVISSEARRVEFKRMFADRFEAEGLIASMRGVGRENVDPHRVAAKALELLDKSTEQLVLQLGDSAPGEAVLFTRKVRNLIQKRLPYRERLLLADRNTPIESEQVGGSLYDALKRQLWDTFCNSKSDTYKCFYNRPLKGLAWSSPVAAQVVQYLKKQEMCWWALAVPLVALFVKVGINTVCDLQRPPRTMVDRR